MKTYVCCDQRRRDAVLAQHTIKGVDYNGIDYLEVSDTLTLLVHFIHGLKAGVLGKENVRVLGGERVSDVAVVSAEVIDEGKARQSKVLQVKVNKQGDYSTYTLRLFANPAKLVLDPQLSSIDFTFGLDKSSPYTDNIDCQAQAACLPEIQPAPEIDYLAKDFTSFRLLMLDRLTTLMPQWKERSTADMGVMLVELLAYVADHLSYQQDVIATESYLSTVRRRISVRRHARLLDYFINEGCNARVWAQVQVNQDLVPGPDNTPVLPQRTKLLTQVSGQDKVGLVPGSQAYYQALNTQPAIFETMAPLRGLFTAHNEIFFYTWSERECCLPKGSTCATLRGALPNLEPGDVLIFKELVDPRTGAEEDAEPSHRCAVRLTKVLPGSDPLGTWPDDKSGIADDPSSLGKVIAEFRIVEEDRLLVEEARMTTPEAGHRIEKQEERFEEDTHTIVQRYLIEKPDKSTVTVEVRMREDEREVHLDLLAAGHIVTEEHTQEEYTVKSDRDEKTRTRRETSERERNGDSSENAGQETEDDEEEIMRQPTAKLPKIPAKQSEDAVDISDEETLIIPAAQDADEEKTGEFETTQEQFDEEEQWGDEGTRLEEERSTRTRIVHTYRIVREPDYSVDITEIEWGYEDVLPFPLCISATTSYEHGHRSIENVSVALGNIVLADHGLTYLEADDKQKDFALMPNSVPASTLHWAITTNGQPCQENSSTPIQVPPRFYPHLRYTPITFAVPYDEHDSTLFASTIMQFAAHDAVPAITLRGAINRTPTPDNTEGSPQSTGTKLKAIIPNQAPVTWLPQRDLLNSEATDPHFVVEVETDGTAFLRFGDDQHGMRPETSTQFFATYRIGNGVPGNIGSDSLYHIVTDNIQLQQSITAIGNPLPALGGKDPESIEYIRQNAEGVFLQQERGVTPQDYKDLAERDPQVHRANAVLRWTGSWYTIFLVVERVGGLPVDDAFKRALRQRLEQFRMAGTELVIVSPVYVPLEITMNVTLKPGFLPDNVKMPFLKVFSNLQWPDGERGVFYPDNHPFGQPVYLNSLFVAASAVPGVDTVTVTTFQRQGIPGTGIADGELALDWLELPILENNPDYPERGLFRVTVDAKEAQHV